jgi:hypothetical protein
MYAKLGVMVRGSGICLHYKKSNCAKRKKTVGSAQGIGAEILADFAKQNPLDWSG